jgi:outer membrane lipoprotein-sorting protein
MMRMLFGSRWERTQRGGSGLVTGMALIIIAGICVSFACKTAISQGLSGKDIIQKTDSLLRGDSSDGVYELQVETPRWKRTLRFRAWEKGRNKSFIRVLGPAKEKGISTLRIGYEMWNYLPSIERSIKVPPSMMFQSWMGSDFTNDDIVKESSIVNDYEHRLLGTEPLGTDTTYKVEAMPKRDAAVVWGKILFWVRIKDFIPLKEEFYSDKGDLIRVLSFSGIREMGGRTIPTVWEMRPVKEKGKRTIFRIVDIHFDIPISDDIFSLEHLRRAD